MLIIPAIDLRNGRCVRLSQGRRDSAKIYDTNPIEMARMFEHDGARMLHVVDLDAAFSEGNIRNREVLRELIATVSIPIQFGGGMRNLEDVEEALSLGVARVVVGTVAAESPATLVEILERFGPQTIVVGIDAKDGRVRTRGWEKHGPTTALKLARDVAELGVERIIYTDVQRDGMLTGINVEQTRRIAEMSGVKVTASGGVSSLDDVRSLAALSGCGIDSVIVGKALYERRFTLKEAQSEC